MTKDIHVVLIDNRDSFIYNLVDTFLVGGYRCTVFRNNVTPGQVLAAKPDLICLSPGPGHPREAGSMMSIIEHALGTVPILGICLGFQALLDHFGGTVEMCGPVHGETDYMSLNQAGEASGIFSGLTITEQPGQTHSAPRVPVARYHSLGCTHVPHGMSALATCPSDIGEVIMAACTDNFVQNQQDSQDSTRDQAGAIGLQFHPESILTPQGPIILDRCIQKLLQH
ncbi:gamma-glutamyl-gamma-aminobutyrate hydrolase family protein [Corynebacterium sp. sy039]|uniref:glutamine amidotransferase-related protein n=1 Tax=Corynebacterium sp. sy039 TaxID=2599641 RepID=UPI0011B62C10|nr:gamma-glutamyl-gamma-aminobutyrate hydrolase family protein [Corynebacterium sp. sy039]QDZ43427.1 anthranilate synthase component II [Corynebacterium sp. sy039]